MLIKGLEGLGKVKLKSGVFDLNGILKAIVNCFGSLVQPLVYYTAGADNHEFG